MWAASLIPWYLSLEVIIVKGQFKGARMSIIVMGLLSVLGYSNTRNVLSTEVPELYGQFCPGQSTANSSLH